MNCTNCGHELPEGSKFCTECGQPVRMTYEPGKSSTKKRHKKKETNPFKRFLKVLLKIVVVLVGIVVAFIVFAILAALFDDDAGETTAPIATQAPIVTPAPTETPELTPEATPEPTPEPTAGLTNAQILEMTGAIVCGIMRENNVESYYIHSEDQLIICVIYDYSFDACKSMGAAFFALSGWEDILKQTYNNTVETANMYGAVNYSVAVNLWSNDQKTIMSFSKAGIDYNIK